MQLRNKTIKQSETFPRIPLPHTHIVVIYFEFKNSDPLFMSQVAALFVTFVPKSFKFQICIFKAFNNVRTSQFFYILQAWSQKKGKESYQLNLGPRSLFSPAGTSVNAAEMVWCYFIIYSRASNIMSLENVSSFLFQSGCCTALLCWIQKNHLFPCTIQCSH